MLLTILGSYFRPSLTGTTLGLSAACTGLLTCGTPFSKGPGKVFAEADHGQLALLHSGWPQGGACGPYPAWHPSKAAMVQKQFRHHVLMLWEILLFPPAMEVLSRDTEAGESKGTAETEEEAAAKDREKSNQAGMCEQGTM